MLSTSVINQTAFHSIIGESSVIRPESDKHKRNIVADLLLTALIDAFSILVIFLLMSFSSTGEILYLGKGQELPKAKLADELDRNPVVKIDDGKLYVEDKQVNADGLVQALLDLRKQFQETRPGQEFPATLTVQADRRVKYEQMSSIVQASAHAGYSDIKFAVIMR